MFSLVRDRQEKRDKTLSSIESSVSELEENYNEILGFFKENTGKLLIDQTGQWRDDERLVISEKVLLASLRQVMNFQRKIEYTFNCVQKLTAKTGQSIRINEIFQGLLLRFCDQKAIFETLTFYYKTDYNVIGVVPLLRAAHRYSLACDFDKCRRSYICAYHGFRLMNASLIELEEELRLISALTIYPIEKRTLLKNQLVINDFEEVAISLEEAESNAENSHFRDTVSRCRDSVEILIAQIREKEAGEKTQRHFATDLGKIAKIGVFDEATQKLIQGVYSFLSLKGSHKYDAEKVTVYDAETSLKETYSLIEMLLKKLSDFRKTE